jgi:hypothetical protein
VPAAGETPNSNQFDGSEATVGNTPLAGASGVFVEMSAEAPADHFQMDTVPAPDPTLPAGEVASTLTAVPPGPELQVEAAPPLAAAANALSGDPGPGWDISMTYVASEPVAGPGSDPSFAAPPGPQTSPLLAGDGQETAALSPAIGPDSAIVSTVSAAPAIPRPSRSRILVPTLLIFLIPYSIVATIAVVRLYMWGQQPSLEVLPDPEKSGGPERRVKTDLEVPAKLRVRLRHTIRVGDIEAAPQKVEWLGDGSLRLTLAIRNVSTDIDFNPLAKTFVEWQRNVPKARKPYTYLEVGPKKRLFGSTWQTMDGGEPYGIRLTPGQQLTAQLTTDQGAMRQKELQKTPGPLLWRVQVRRGFVQYKGRDVSTTTVVGIEFDPKEIDFRDREEASAWPGLSRLSGDVRRRLVH